VEDQLPTPNLDSNQFSVQTYEAIGELEANMLHPIPQLQIFLQLMKWKMMKPGIGYK